MSELSHYGKLGMKWGQHKAKVAAKDQALLESRARHDALWKREVAARKEYNSATTAAGMKRAEKALGVIGREQNTPQGRQDSKNFYNRVLTSKEKRKMRLTLAGGTVVAAASGLIVGKLYNVYTKHS